MPLDWDRLLEAWVLIEFDFQAIHHVDLSDEIPRRSFRWFRTRLFPLLAHPDSLLGRRFRPERTEDGGRDESGVDHS